MAKSFRTLCFSIWLLVATTTSIARLEEKLSECQVDKINALEADHRIESEGGITETWNSNHPELKCAGVTLVRRIIESKGLHLPSFTTYPQLIMFLQGEGAIGIPFPGCPDTYEEPQSQMRQRRIRRGSQQQQQGDSHQKIRHFKQGDIVAIPPGIPYWTYNYGNERVIAITLLDTTNLANQLDQTPRRFYLAGSPEEEHPETQGQQEQHKRTGGGRRHGQHQQQKEQGEENNNVLNGFSSRFLAQAFGVDEEIAKRVQNPQEQKDQIIKVEGGLDILSPKWQEDGEQEERGGRRRVRRGRREEQGEEDEDEDEEDEQPWWPRRGGRGRRQEEDEDEEKEGQPRRRRHGRRQHGEKGHKQEDEEEEKEEDEEEDQPWRRQRGRRQHEGRGRRQEEDEDEDEESWWPQRGRGQHGRRGRRQEEEDEDEEEDEESWWRQRGRGQHGRRGRRQEDEDEDEEEDEESWWPQRGRGQHGRRGRRQEDEDEDEEEDEESWWPQRGRGQHGRRGRKQEEEDEDEEDEDEEDEEQTWPRQHGQRQHGGKGHKQEQEEEDEDEEWWYPRRQQGQKGHREEEEEEDEETWRRRHRGQQGRRHQTGKGREQEEEEDEDEEQSWWYPRGQQKRRGHGQEEEQQQERWRRQSERGQGKRRGSRHWQEEEEEGQCNQKIRNRHASLRRQKKSKNGLEETLCSVKLHENIARPSRADFYNPGAGRISTVNSLTLPILKWFQLSAEHLVLYKNGIYSPHWNINANSVVYAIRGEGKVQMVNCQGKLVFNGVLRRGQILVVPQNFVVAVQAGNEGFEAIAFKTNDRATISPVKQVIRGIPAEVLMNAFGLRQHQVSALKNSGNQSPLVSSDSPYESEGRALAI